MRHLLLAVTAAVALAVVPVLAQESDQEQPAESVETPSLEGLKESVDGAGERLTIIENELDKLRSLKISGYVQTEWQHFDQTSSVGGAALYSDGRRHVFTVRRGRIKFQHKLGDVMSYTVQPDITESGVSIKDAFLTIAFDPVGDLRVDAGMFNRPNYEVELSSSSREATERSQVVRAFYPGERDLGIMFTARQQLFESFDPRLQVGVFNGPGTRTEIDAFKDVIARLTMPLPLGGNSPLQVDVGASYYYGGIPQNGATVRTFEAGIDSIRTNTETGGMAGWGNNWNSGVEAQLYLDVLPIGGTIIRAEWLTGQRATPGSAAVPASVGVGKDSAGKDIVKITPAVAATPVTLREQSGFYVYFVQNIGKDLQVVARFDQFDRNTQLSDVTVKSVSDAASSVLGFGANYFYENIRLSVYYEIPRFAESETIRVASGRVDDSFRATDVKDNKTTIRLQYRF